MVAWTSLGAPADLYLAPRAGARAAPAHRRSMRTCSASARSRPYEQFSFPGWNGETVYGYVMKPYGFAAGRKYPIAFIVHGGPQVSLQNQWNYRWNAQVFAGHGYAVVFIDFHGSPGLRPDVHGFHFAGLGRQAARRPAEGARSGRRPLRLARRRARLLARALLRRLHAELDRRQLAGPLPAASSTTPASSTCARCTTPPRSCGSRSGRTAGRTTTKPEAAREVQPGELRHELAHADARDCRRVATTACRTRRDSRPSPRCNGAAYRAGSCTSPTRVTGS